MMIFIRNKISAELLLDFLEKKFGIEVDSLDRRKPNSPVYAQFLEYEKGFKLLLTLAGNWPSEWSDLNLAQSIAENFQTLTLVELDEPINGKEYALIQLDSAISHVNIIESENGISVK